MEKRVPLDKITYFEPDRHFCRKKKILLAIDGSEGASHAATVGFEIAELTNSKIYIIYVVPTPRIKQYSLMTGANATKTIELYKDNGKRLLDGYRKAAEKYRLNPELIIEEGLPSERIIAHARDKEVDMIVMGSRGAEATKRVGMGSTTERVVVGSECTVVVAK
jgi:nucleotide-binding universal stress UspA family protein